jgi:hypothetical protein
MAFKEIPSLCFPASNLLPTGLLFSHYRFHVARNRPVLSSSTLLVRLLVEHFTMRLDTILLVLVLQCSLGANGALTPSWCLKCSDPPPATTFAQFSDCHIAFQLMWMDVHRNKRMSLNHEHLWGHDYHSLTIPHKYSAGSCTVSLVYKHLKQRHIPPNQLPLRPQLEVLQNFNVGLQWVLRECFVDKYQFGSGFVSVPQGDEIVQYGFAVTHTGTHRYKTHRIFRS